MDVHRILALDGWAYNASSTWMGVEYWINIDVCRTCRMLVCWYIQERVAKWNDTFYSCVLCQVYCHTVRRMPNGMLSNVADQFDPPSAERGGKDQTCKARHWRLRGPDIDTEVSQLDCWGWAQARGVLQSQNNPLLICSFSWILNMRKWLIIVSTFSEILKIKK